MPNYDELLQDLARLRVENASLRALLRVNGIALPDAAPRLGAPAAAICEVDIAAPCAERMNAESAVMPVTKASPLSEKNRALSFPVSGTD